MCWESYRAGIRVEDLFFCYPHSYLVSQNLNVNICPRKRQGSVPFEPPLLLEDNLFPTKVLMTPQGLKG